MKKNRNHLKREKIILFTILILAIGGLMLGANDCTGTIGVSCVDNTKFCAIIKEFAPSSVQPALEDCPTSLTICDGEQIELYWQADATWTSNVHITGPGGESYDFPISEGHATVTPRTSGDWKVEFTGNDCTFKKSIKVRVIKGEEPYTIVANGNTDIGFFCDVNPKSVSSKLIIKEIWSVHCAGVAEYWENWSCKKTNWNGSNPIFFNITINDGSANCTPLAGRWRFDPSGLGGTFNYTAQSACFQATITCGPCNGTTSDIFPPPTTTPWPTRNPQ